MKQIKRFILVQENTDGITDSFMELDQTNHASEANRLVKYYESCNCGKVLVLSTYSDQKRRISLLNR